MTVSKQKIQKNLQKVKKMTQKAILEIIGQKQPDYNKKTARTWLKNHPIFVKELDPEIVANQYLNELKEQVRLEALEAKKGILLGTIDRKFSRSSKIQKVFADILTDDGLERLQWWGSIPKENKNMQVLPILKECLFMGAMTDAWVSPSGEEYTNFDIEAIQVPTKKKTITPDDLIIPSTEIIDPSTNVHDLPEGKYMVAVIGKIAAVHPYQEKSWDEMGGEFVFGADHPLLMSSNLCLRFGIRVNEDIYVKAHFPEQKLGWPTWAISNDLKKVDGIKQVLAGMPVNATTERKMAVQLQNQVNTINSIFKEFSVTAIGEARISRSESVDEIRTFIEMFPSFISVSAADISIKEGETLTTLEDIEDPDELADAEEIADAVEREYDDAEEIISNKLDDKTEFVIKQIQENTEIIDYNEIRGLIEKKKEELGFFVNDTAAAFIIAKDLGLTIESLSKADPDFESEVDEIDAPPVGLTEAKLIYETVNEIGTEGEAMAKAKVKELKQQYERLGIEINLESLIKTAAEELKVDITGYEKKQAKFAEQEQANLEADIAKQAIEKTKPKKKEKPAPKTKKKTTPRKKKTKTKDKWAEHYAYINEVFATFEDEHDAIDTSLLPMPIWDILLLAGCCFEPEEGVIHITQTDMKLNTDTKKTLHKFFNKNPDIVLRPPDIEDVEKTVREKLTALKNVVPNSSPEHLKALLSSDNLDCPVELITKIWESI